MNPIVSIVIAAITAILKAAGPALSAEDLGKMKLEVLEAMDKAADWLTDAEKEEWDIVNGVSKD